MRLADVVSISHPALRNAFPTMMDTMSTLYGGQAHLFLQGKGAYPSDFTISFDGQSNDPKTGEPRPGILYFLEQLISKKRNLSDMNSREKVIADQLSQMGLVDIKDGKVSIAETGKIYLHRFLERMSDLRSFNQQWGTGSVWGAK